MSNNIRLIKLVNGMDLIADIIPSNEFKDSDITMGGIRIGEIIRLKKPRTIMMQHTPQGISIGLVPFNIEDHSDSYDVDIFRSSLISILALPEGSKLLVSYLETTSGLDLSPLSPQGFKKW